MVSELPPFPLAETIPLDPIATIFIFLIGLPAILLQTLPSEVRRTVLHWRWQLALFTILPILLAGFVVLVALALVPEGGEERELHWTVVLAVLLLITGVTTLLLADRWRRAAVVDQLYRMAARGIPKPGRPVERNLRDLTLLGVQSKVGQDKEMVIDACGRLSRDVQAVESYDGAQLEELLFGLEQILVSGAEFASANNFRVAGDILIEVVAEARGRTQSDDLKIAIQTVSELGRASLRHRQPSVGTKYVDALAKAAVVGLEDGEESARGVAMWASQALFEVGSAAADANQMLVAMAALSKLDSLVDRLSPVDGEIAWDFAGLLAHFWEHGETARSYIQPTLDDAGTLFTRPLDEVMAKSAEHCRMTSRFRTADYLRRLGRSLEQ